MFAGDDFVIELNILCLSGLAKFGHLFLELLPIRIVCIEFATVIKLVIVLIRLVIPTLYGAEVVESDRVELLGVLGFQVTENIGRTGAVALYRNRSGPTVLVRTELVSKLGAGEEASAVVKSSAYR